VPNDPGYFGERLIAAHNRILGAWIQKAAHLRPDFKQTDIFGALELASQLFAEEPGAIRKQLIIFSDMRESVPGLDFERLKLIPAYVDESGRCGELISLTDVYVYAAGVDGAGKSMAYWDSLHRFWLVYFHLTGAVLGSFAVPSELPDDQRIFMGRNGTVGSLQKSGGNKQARIST
jgi:hypothetical protein